MRKILIAIGMFWSCLLLAQKEDYTWIMGMGQIQDTITRKLNYITFPNDTFNVVPLNKSNPLFGTNAVISDDIGNLVCYSNGINIYNREHEIMPNGQGFQSASQFPYGYPFEQASLILPWPDSTGIYLTIDGHYKDIIIDGIMDTLRYSIINANLLGGLGTVTQKKIVFTHPTDTINVGHLTACRHANGRDWWVLITKFESHIFRRYLLSPSGLKETGEQSIGNTVHNGVGYSSYSPDGERYARYIAYGQTSDPHAMLYLYLFDRCTGLLSEPLEKFFPGQEVYGGIAFSPNSRYLYLGKFTKVYQYDLEADDVLASEQIVAEYDGFKDDNTAPTRFYGLQLAPDGKIYGIVPGFNSRYLHVIDQPNLPGLACNVIQHAIHLPAYNFGTIPNLPFYRLYAAEGSCDSLGVPTYAPPVATSPTLRVWPVPAVDVLYFSTDGGWPDPLDLRLYDAMGRLALYQPALQLQPVAKIDLETLPAGAYYYTLCGANGVVVKSGRVVRTQ